MFAWPWVLFQGCGPMFPFEAQDAFFGKDCVLVNQSICDLADANLLQAIREHARWQSPCELVEQDGVPMMACR